MLLLLWFSLLFFALLLHFVASSAAAAAASVVLECSRLSISTYSNCSFCTTIVIDIDNNKYVYVCSIISHTVALSLLLLLLCCLFVFVYLSVR